MLKIKKLFNRSLAAALCCFTVLSALAGLQFNSFAASDVLLDCTANKAMSVTSKSSLVVSAPSTYYYYRKSTSEGWENNMCGNSVPGVFYDGSFTYNSYNTIGKTGENKRSFAEYSSDYSTVTKYCTDGTLRYATITYDLGTVCRISDILIAGRNVKDYCMGKYVLYAGTTAQTLFNAENLLYTYDYTKNSAGNANPQSYEPYMYQTYSSSTLSARYVSIKVTMPNIGDCTSTKNLTGAVINLAEFNVYGTKNYYGVLTTNGETISENLFKSFGGSVVSSPATVTGHIVNPDSTITDQSFGYASTILSDSNIETNDYLCSGFKFAKMNESDGKPESQASASEYYTDGTKRYLDLVYDFGRLKKIKNIVVSNHPSDILRTGNYCIYASDSKDTLFNGENIVYAYESVGSVLKNHVFTFNDNNTAARYVAMRVFNPYATDDAKVLSSTPVTSLYTNCYLRLHEFNVYGFDSHHLSGENYSADQYNKILKDSNSLIAGRSASSAFVFSGGNKSNMTEANYEQNEYNERVSTTDKYPYFSILTDGNCSHDDEIRGNNLCFADKDKKLIDDESQLYCQFNYPFDAEATVSSFEMYGHPTAALNPSHYRISFAQNEEDLFTENAVYESGDIYSNVGTLSRLTFGTEITAKYVGLRIICGVSASAAQGYNYTNLYLRLCELSVFGKYVASAGDITTYNSINTISNGVKKKSGSAKLKYQCVPDSDGKFALDSKASLEAEASVRYNGELYSFLNWTDGTGNIVSEDLAITTKTDVVLTANYGITTKTVKLTFCNHSGEEIYSTNVIFGQYLTKAQYTAANKKLGAVAGYRLRYDTVSFGSRTALMPTWNADIYNYAASANITFYPIYEPEETLYKVTYGTDVKNLAFDRKVTYTESTAGYWTVNGEKWCTGTTFTAYVCGDMDIKAVTGTSTKYISLFNKAYISENFMGFTSQLSLPANATINECGMLFLSGDYTKTADYTSGTFNNLTLANADVQKVTVKTPSGSGYMVTLTGVARKHTRVARAFVSYTVGSSTYTVYSNAVTATMN